MEDNLAIIRRIIDWHRTIREHVKLVGDLISDREALFSLEKARADWIPGRPEILAEEQRKLRQALSFLEDGLKNHFAYEEKALPPLLGELLTQALILEHREISTEIEEAKSMAADIKLEGLDREELLLRESHVRQAIDGICQGVEHHAAREETVLEMLERALA